MTVYGCPKCGKILTFRAHMGEDDLSDVRANTHVGCTTCGLNLCGDCGDDIGHVCYRCGSTMGMNVVGKATGDWRLPDRLREIEGEEARLEELAAMEAEWLIPDDYSGYVMQEQWRQDKARHYRLLITTGDSPYIEI